jgi:hypothetical protein
MNSTTQLEFHPDAENLNAFAEKALPERERGQILAHLAVCSRCRQVIFLAQEAATKGAAAEVRSGHSEKRIGSWFSGWRLALIPAAALATVVALAYMVHVRHVEPGTEMAKVTIPVAPQNEASNVNTPSNNRVSTGKLQTPVSPVPVQRSESIGQSKTIVAASQPNLEEAVPSPAPPAGAGAIAPPSAERVVTMTSAASAGQVIDMDQLKPEPAAAARLPQRVAGSYSSNATAAYAPRAKTDEMEEREKASRKAEARFDGAGGASTSRLKKNVSPHSSYDASAPLSVVQFETGSETKPSPLPSGLAAVSTVTEQNRTLALDQAGTLFLSEDSGSNWESVARQWAGRAVEVRLQRPGTGSTAVAGVPLAPAPPVAVFEIVNDQNLIWVSMDGRTWKAQ